MQNLKTQLHSIFFISFFALPFLNACGQVPQKSETRTLASDAGSEKSSVINETEESSSWNTEGKTNTSSTASTLSVSDKIVYRNDFRIRFGQIARALESRADQALETVLRRLECAKVGTAQDDRPEASQYRCGELPFGKILNGQKKSILEFTIPSQKSSKDGVRFSTESAKVVVHLNRKQSGGKLELSMLPAKQLIDVRVSDALGDDVFVRLNPQGGRLEQELCIAIPSLSVGVQPTRIKGKFSKESFWPLPDIKGDFVVDVDVGQMLSKPALTCLELETVFNAQGALNLDLVKVRDPKFSEVNFDGIVVKANADVGGFWGFLNSVTKVVGFDIEKKVAEAVKREASKTVKEELNIQAADVRTGKWFSEYIEGAHLKRLVNSISKQLSKKVNEDRFGVNEIETTIQGFCLASALATPSITGAERSKVFQACRAGASVEFVALKNDASQRQLGCYSHFFDIRKSQESSGELNDWAKECSILNTVEVKASGRLQSLYTCSFEAWNDSKSPLAACAAEVTELVQSTLNGSLDDLINSAGVIEPLSEEKYMELQLIGQQMGLVLPARNLLLSIWK